jgi:hypothetical protein
VTIIAVAFDTGHAVLGGDQWAHDQDPVAQWMSEACEVGRAFEKTHGALYASYRAWCEQAGHNRPYVSSIALGRALRQQQHDDGAPLFGERNRPELVWTGLRLRTPGAPASGLHGQL